MRTYQETHPWINFQLYLRDLDYRIWMLLGIAQAKIEHVRGTPLSPETAEEFRGVYLAKGALATTAIEGNTLTEDEVRRRIDHQLELPPSKEYLGQEIDNVVRAYNAIGDFALSSDDTRVTVDMLKTYNALVLQDLPLGEDVVPGQVRQHSVTVGRYRGAPAEDLDYLLEAFVTWLNDGFGGIPKGYEMAFGILKAIIAHVYIAWIHPFGDGNGRTARLLEFQILLCVGVPDTAAHLLSNFYNETRSEYYRQLDKTSREENGIMAFVGYALQGYVDSLDEQIKVIKDAQLRVHWRNYIRDLFSKSDSRTHHRQRRLMLDLADVFVEEEGKAIPISRLRHLTPRIAEAYANKSDKTIRRDINTLKDMGLIWQTPNGIIPRVSLLRAFLPQHRDDVP